MTTGFDLGSVPLFQGLPQKQLHELEEVSQEVGFDKNQVIFSQEDPGNGFYVLISGRVKVYKLSLDGREQILHVFGPGEPIGEVPVFAGDTFPAHALALEPTRLLFFPRERLRTLFEQDPSLALNMLAVLARRLREFTRLVEDLSLKELPSRLASYLAQLQDAQGGREQVTLEVSKGTLAKVLGTSQETLSRVLKRMGEAGIIEVDKRRITILQDGALEDLAEGYMSLG
ncbi:Crp/Fnr family transcriptional regulator [Desulfovermiculus halophilus]|jgi:CRP/FNR family transcriptional regulator|uniref:Crp/Fnr family transcriptional regulator n=1 Tax=Desulfovermiculus halophilus TaxID=339722 RepID=UPI00048608A9|nr:Crp/Fnr family transcriptional regulator [Desulfovermiculus halophilus]